LETVTTRILAHKLELPPHQIGKLGRLCTGVGMLGARHADTDSIAADP
jgi:hypothetical protein